MLNFDIFKRDELFFQNKCIRGGIEMNIHMSRGVVAAVLLAVLFALPAQSQTATPPAPAQIKEIAEEAYLYGLQQVIYVGQRWISTQNDSTDNVSYVGINRMSWVRKQITPDFPVVTPNATTLYGTGFLDMRQEPMIVEMPEITDRYFSLQVMDQYGIFHTIVGSPFNGTKARKYLFVPPGYDGKLPGEFPTTDVIAWPSKTAFVAVRIAVETGTDEEIAKINGYQDQITTTLLSDWIANGKAGVPQADRQIIKGDFEVYPRIPEIAIGQVDKQSAQDFYTLLNMVLNDPSMTLIDDSLVEARMLDQLKTIGIGNGLAFDWNALPSETKDALEAGFKAGFDSVRKALVSGLIDMNGWGSVRNAGGFQTRWMDRAIIADAAWAAPDRNISHAGAFRFTDSDGEPLNGANTYTITFDTNDLPPVTQFWSIPIYNADGYFVANEINRYTINSFMLERGDLVVKDGKLVIPVQHNKPEDPDMAKNWLPAPPETFRFTARFYGPYVPLTDGSYMMPAPVKTGTAN
jgi:hypothetical protein